ncbi:ARM repeat-containing protein [Saccharata proteae CBS 121410]|uniref:ARM repeat-containing protein n=1 Tax=Saccharata proteae CBS 121410 TaxID=1314787 RepID=A0A9P4HS43_9PEZI|nr:ARM repeat-containing protein [Saccharata proteae CBS 121410]
MNLDTASQFPNGGAAPPPSTTSTTDDILTALQAIYHPQSTNAIRIKASAYLDGVKKLPEAPAHGYALARDSSQDVHLRYYGLTLLEHAVKYGWDEVDGVERERMRGFVVDLAEGVTAQDAVFLRNKVAQVWVEVGKRAWGGGGGDGEDGWRDMDERLVRLWGKGGIEHQGLVLYVLETLAEEVFNREDPVAGVRGKELGKACVAVFTPAVVMRECLPKRDTEVSLRFGEEGWVTRVCGLLDWCLGNGVQTDEKIAATAVKALNTLRAVMPWLIPKAIEATGCVNHIGRALSAPVVSIQTAAVEALFAVYSRSNFSDTDFVALVCPMYTSEIINLFEEMYSWTAADLDIHDLDEPKYNLSKKLSELLANLGSFVESRPKQIPDGCNIPGFLSLLFQILRHPSLTVSIPVLHAWTRLLRCRPIRDSDTVMQMIGGLLELCSQRLMRYENLPEDSEDPTVVLLSEDIDTIPERHAFLGNYRRYCVDIVEVIVRRVPVEAMQHILGQATNLFQTLYQGQPAFDPQTFSKNSTAVLRVDAQITVIDAAMRGYLKWLDGHSSDPQKVEAERTAMQEAFEQWCQAVLRISFEDPEIIRMVTQLMVTFATKALSTRPSFALHLLDNILSMPNRDNPAFPKYSEAVKGLEQTSVHEIKRLAMVFPNEFLTVYDDLERKINEIVSTQTTDDRQRMGYSAFLFLIVHRSTTLDATTQRSKLQQMLNPITEGWQNPAFRASLDSFESFCEMLFLGDIANFLAVRGFQNTPDWASRELDTDGQTKQAEILFRFQELPLRSTKSLLAVATEKLREGSQSHELACAIWADTIPLILPSLLKLISHAQAFYNMSSWSHLPPEMQAVLKRVLTDRFWQAGISTESRDDFFARVSGSKSSYEGFASTIRGTVRQIREVCYYILYGMTRLGDFFYGISDLPGPLSTALFADAGALSAHHVSVLLNVAAQLIERCPTHQWQHFLPPIVSNLFRELDAKITSEWDLVNQQISQADEHENLGDEMKNESILRQLTYTAISMVSIFLDDKGGAPQSQPQPPTTTTTTINMSNFILTTPTVLEPILLFCKNTLRVRDTRTVALATRVLRNLIPHFRAPSPVHAYICHDVLQAAITSLHEPYFVDSQKDLASLIALIIHLDSDNGATSRTVSVIASLPGLRERPDRVDRKIRAMLETGSERTQRSMVLDLLASVRGVSIHEQGKLERATGKAEKKKKGSGIREEYMAVEEQKPGTGGIVRGGSPVLAGMADMFG